MYIHGQKMQTNVRQNIQSVLYLLYKGGDSIRPSELFVEVTGQNGLFNIQAIDNIPSIMRYGLLSNERAKRIAHTSIAMQ